jgi:hypothetical protein
MCRSIKPLFNFDPPATEAEIRGAALQFVRKLSGFQKPSKVNEKVFDDAVDHVAAAAQELLVSLVTTAEPRDRQVEAERARARFARRFPESIPHHHPHDHEHGDGHEHSHGHTHDHHHDHHNGPGPVKPLAEDA